MGTSQILHQQSVRFTQLTKKFLETRRRTEELCHPLAKDDFMLSVTEDTSPPKWHLAHTSWFFERFVLQKFKNAYESYRPEFNFLFNSYYKHAGSYLKKSKRNVISRPTIDEVIQYRNFVTESVMSLLGTTGIENHGDILRVLEVGIHHEQQHQELLLMDIKRNFFENPMRPQYQKEVYSQGDISEIEWREFNEGVVRIGVPENYQSFAFDNERPQHQVWLDSFQLCSRLVTNDEYAAFIDEGGYMNPKLWLSDGWEFKEKEDWQRPLYWEKQGQNWWVMTLSGMIPLDLSAPVVHVSYYEAQAFAKWKGVRLPTEAEWETAARLEQIKGDFLESGNFEPSVGNYDYENFAQIHGSVWEWTQSSFHPYPRYKAWPQGLSEYNEKFMCNQYVLRGGSCITPQDHYRISYRNFYYPHMRWMYGGIRLAKDVE